jgi:hypothetical protein
VQGFRDSTTYNVAATAAQADTTAPFYMSQYVPWLSTSAVAAAASSDTSGFLFFEQTPSPGTAQTFPSTTDTSYAKLQVSMNGLNWIDIKSGSGAGNWITATEKVVTAATYTLAGTNAFYWVYGAQVGNANALTPQIAPNAPLTTGLLDRSAAFGPWMMGRLIIQNSGREGGEFIVLVDGYKVTP